MLYRSQNKLNHNIVQDSIIKVFRNSTVYASSFHMACPRFYSIIKAFTNNAVKVIKQTKSQHRAVQRCSQRAWSKGYVQYSGSAHCTTIVMIHLFFLSCLLPRFCRFLGLVWLGRHRRQIRSIGTSFCLQGKSVPA